MTNTNKYKNMIKSGKYINLGSLLIYISKGISPKYVDVRSENTICVLNQKCNKNFTISYKASRLHDSKIKPVSDEKILRKGDVLINSTGRGTAGRVAQIDKIAGLTTVDGHMIILRCVESVDKIYFGYALKSKQTQIESLAEGSTGQTEINRKRLCDEVFINIPDISEQVKIASMLKSLDDKIELNRKMNENIEQQAAALFKHWFVDFEFPDENGNPYRSSGGKMKESSLGMIPERWEIAKLSDVMKFNPTERLARGVRAKRIAMDKLVPYSKNIPSYDYAEFKGGTKFKNGDTLLARITPCLENGKVAYVSLLDQEEIAFGSTEYIVMRGHKEGLSNEYVYCLASSPHFRDIAIQSMVGSSGRQRVQQSVLDNYLLAVPAARVLERFSMIIHAFDSQGKNINRQNDRLIYLRDTLLSKFMSLKN